MFLRAQFLVKAFMIKSCHIPQVKRSVCIDSLAVVRGPEIALVPYYGGLPPKVNSDKYDESTKRGISKIIENCFWITAFPEMFKKEPKGV